MDPADTYLLLRLGQRHVALPHIAVREVLPLPRLFRPPALPRSMAGFLNLGGAAVPVLDLARLFGLTETAEAEAALYRHVVLLKTPLLGLLVDRVFDLVRVPTVQLRPLPEALSLNGCAAAELPLQDGFAHLLAPDRILLAQEAAAVHSLQEMAQTRLAGWAEPA
ncbi:chemotaxis protein CheW [Pseudoroseomonas globiformis]|uniref:Chemotaxis protein CheW n=1 Tax=Teichococcus globiformis TaxID=2307229 RepID=A0ABV7G4X9_9PROT